MWSTDVYRRWTAIAGIAAALERKVWIRSQKANIYPNLYTFLVGPPAVGKTRPLQGLHEIWDSTFRNYTDPHKGLKIAPVSLTKASLMDELAAATRHDPRLDPQSFNAMFIISKELGALLPIYDPDFLNALTYIYDNLKYDEKRRGSKDPLVIDSPQLNMLGATTPSYLLDTMPPGAWEQGFLSRTIIIYHDIVEERELNLTDEDPPDDITLRAALENDLRVIAERCGRMLFHRDAGPLLERWHADIKGRPSHPRLQNYNSRRTFHAMKLCMIAAVDAGHEVIEVEDVQEALNWLAQAEHEMAQLFITFKTGGDATVIMEAHHYMYSISVRQGSKPIPAHYLYEFLGARMSSYKTQPTVELMVRSKLITSSTVEGIGMFTVNPRPIGLL